MKYMVCVCVCVIEKTSLLAGMKKMHLEIFLDSVKIGHSFAKFV